MTALLLEELRHLHVVELDRDLVERLKKRFDAARLTVHSADALKFDFASIPVPEGRKLRVVGNLPYNISSPLLFHLAEIARRCRTSISCCKGSGRAHGGRAGQQGLRPPVGDAAMALSHGAAVRGAADRLRSAAQGGFGHRAHDPAGPAHGLQQALLEQVVTKAFSQRRKVIRNCVAGLFSEDELRQAGVDPQDRPEAVPVEQFVALANLLAARQA
jgi:16S rRNA (adenine1518-N6/adenine1519-N6)-dimethyltransferase